jgi:hypothetical protein
LAYLMRHQAEAQLKSYEAAAVSLSDAIGAQFFERYGDVQAFAMNPVMRTGNRSAMTQTLNEYAALYGIYDLILVTDMSGKLIAVNSLSPAGKPIESEKLYTQDFSKAPWFHEASAGHFTEDKEKAFLGTYAEA